MNWPAKNYLTRNKWDAKRRKKPFLIKARNGFWARFARFSWFFPFCFIKSINMHVYLFQIIATRQFNIHSRTSAGGKGVKGEGSNMVYWLKRKNFKIKFFKSTNFLKCHKAQFIAKLFIAKSSINRPARKNCSTILLLSVKLKLNVKDKARPR